MREQQKQDVAQVYRLMNPRDLFRLGRCYVPGERAVEMVKCRRRGGGEADGVERFPVQLGNAMTNQISAYGTLPVLCQGVVH